MSQKKLAALAAAFVFVLMFALAGSPSSTHAQGVTATLSGRILDASGGSVAKAAVSIVNTATGFTRSVQSSDAGEYFIPALPAGEYSVSVEYAGFRKQTKNITLQVGQTAELDFSLSPGEVTQKVEVEATSELAEPTRTQVSTVITERQIVNLPVNGREFINFALLSPAVTIGDTTAGNTDVIVEPVTKLSFAGQNIHYNFIAVENTCKTAQTGPGADFPDSKQTRTRAHA
ncbi:MAG: carboxypeptidase-like regulatory domain-containing protein [Acidobacteriia bacterium]|nr:carboxypeptidase-like regulatory domain-containing protein [Terriglobia bacterium]